MAVKDFDHFMDHRPLVPVESDNIFGKNLVSLRGQKWKDMRATVSPSFTSSKMKMMFGLISECANDFVDHFKQNSNQDVTTIEMKDIFTRFTNDVIATAVFGIEINSLKDKDNEFYVMGRNMTNFSGFWKGIKFLGFFAFPRLFKVRMLSKLGTYFNYSSFSY